jgi:hypothetical protein
VQTHAQHRNSENTGARPGELVADPRWTARQSAPPNHHRQKLLNIPNVCEPLLARFVDDEDIDEAIAYLLDEGHSKALDGYEADPSYQGYTLTDAGSRYIKQRLALRSCSGEYAAASSVTIPSTPYVAAAYRFSGTGNPR